MILKYILSIFLLVASLFASNIRVIDNFSTAIYSHRTLDKASSKKVKKRHSIKVAKIKRGKKAKVIIIVDDVSNYKQLKKIQNLPFKVTPSIFPPSRMNMHSNRLAKGLKHFMVHLPLESGNKKLNKMYKTLFTYNTQKQIQQRVKEIRRLFPTAKFLNNHTGSKFSKNYRASKQLFRALKKEGFIFVDSRTTKDTQFPKIAKEFKTHYYKADLFIDNIPTINAIKKRIKEATRLAKRHGYVVMIGHPHRHTLQALRQSKNLLKNFNVIYIDEL